MESPSGLHMDALCPVVAPVEQHRAQAQAISLSAMSRAPGVVAIVLSGDRHLSAGTAVRITSMGGRREATAPGRSSLAGQAAQALSWPCRRQLRHIGQMAVHQQVGYLFNSQLVATSRMSCSHGSGSLPLRPTVHRAVAGGGAGEGDGFLRLEAGGSGRGAHHMLRIRAVDAPAASIQAAGRRLILGRQVLGEQPRPGSALVVVTRENS